MHQGCGGGGRGEAAFSTPDASAVAAEDEDAATNFCSISTTTRAIPFDWVDVDVILLVDLRDAGEDDGGSQAGGLELGTASASLVPPNSRFFTFKFKYINK